MGIFNENSFGDFTSKKFKELLKKRKYVKSYINERRCIRKKIKCMINKS